MIGAALDVGMTHAEFWSISMRELRQCIESASRRAKSEHEARLVVAALQTAELVNVVGSLGAGSKWRPVSPKRYFDAWSGQASDAPAMTADEYRAKMAIVEAQVNARYARRRTNRAAGIESEIHPDTTRNATG